DRDLPLDRLLRERAAQLVGAVEEREGRGLDAELLAPAHAYGRATREHARRQRRRAVDVEAGVADGQRGDGRGLALEARAQRLGVLQRAHRDLRSGVALVEVAGGRACPRERAAEIVQLDAGHLPGSSCQRGPSRTATPI